MGTKTPSPQPSPAGRGSRHGFTLVELSIVIVVLGLLIAATMAGGTLLYTSKLKSLIGEIEGYKIAVDNFSIQYEALPGDIKNATSFWAAASSGDGNGQIGAGGATLTGFALESYFIWNHLTLSKFIPGTFSGTSTAVATVGTNIPTAKYMESAGFGINYFTAPFAYQDTLLRNFPGNYIVVGRTATTTNYPQVNALIPADALYIDMKIDEGTPKYGKILSGDGPTFATGASCITGSAYNTTTSTAACISLISIDNK